ncbi:hypothetical protein TcCL_ESM12770, partial [Trypanosoma cruzi]
MVLVPLASVPCFLASRPDGRSWGGTAGKYLPAFSGTCYGCSGPAEPGGRSEGAARAPVAWRRRGAASAPNAGAPCNAAGATTTGQQRSQRNAATSGDATLSGHIADP